jgi:hypothetical protein
MKKEDKEDKKWSSEYPFKPLEESLMEKLVGISWRTLKPDLFF